MQGAVLVAKHPDGSPFAGEDQLWPAVSIQVREEGGTNQSGILKCLRVRTVKGPLAGMIPINSRRRRFRPAPRNDPAPDKQIELAIAIDVSHRDRSTAGCKGWQWCFGVTPLPFKLHDGRGWHAPLLVACCSSKDGGAMRSLVQNQKPRLISSHW